MPLSKKQNEYIREATARWNIKIGAVRSGKTYMDIAYVIPERLRAVHGLPGLNVLLGVSRETLERNVLQPMRERYTSRLVGTINSRNVARIFGEDTYCIGAEKISQVSKIQGMSIKYCYGDEIAKWSKEVFTMLQSRLDKSYSKFDGSCNPENPGHWLKKFIDREDIDKYVQKYTIFDNPFLPKEFIENLCKEYAGTVFYDRYINGEWTLAEGLIYPMYESALCERPEAPKPGEKREWVLSADYGTMNAFAVILWEKVGAVWYAVSEYYYSGRTTQKQKSDPEYAAEIDEWMEYVFSGYEDENGEPRKPPRLELIIDPSAASFIALMRKRDGRYKVIPAKNSVLDGIRDTAACMQTGKIKICRTCKHLIEELGGYAWDENETEDRPIKVNDHACDAMRYFVETKHLAKVKRAYDHIIF